MTLDDLVAQRKINQDQKAQILKKPALHTQLKEHEEQIVMQKKIEEDFSKRLQTQKDLLQAQHEKELAEVKSSAATTPAPLDEIPKPDLRGPLLTLSKFLRAAAARRQDSDENSEDSKGFEGVLLLLYGGDNAAVDAAEKLIDGSLDLIPATEGGDTATSYGRVKQLAVEYAPFASEEAWVNGVADASATGEPSSDQQAVSDPTISNAGLTELSSTPIPSTTSAKPASLSGPNVGTVDSGASNAAGLAQSTEPLADSWVSIPRAPEETESHNAAASAAVQTNQTEGWAEQTTGSTTDSWAQAQPVNPGMDWGGESSIKPATESWADSPMDTVTMPTAHNGDGFHEVHHGRGPSRGGRGGGGFNGGFDGRGRGRGSFPRGDRGRGDFRGRGRGGFEGRGGGRGRGRGPREGGAPGF